MRARSRLRDDRFWMLYERLELTNGRGGLHARRLLTHPPADKTVFATDFFEAFLLEFYPACACARTHVVEFDTGCPCWQARLLL